MTTTTTWAFPPIYDDIYDSAPRVSVNLKELPSTFPALLEGNLQQTNISTNWTNCFQGWSQQLNTTFTPTGYIFPSINGSTSDSTAASRVQYISYNSDNQMMQLNNSGEWLSIMTISLVSTEEFNNFTLPTENSVHFLYNTELNELWFVKGSTKTQVI